MTIHRSRIISVVAAFLVSISWLGAAHAAPIVVDWDVVPHDDTVLSHGDSQHYDCDGAPYGQRLCYSLWDTGLTLEAISFSFFDDKFFDGTGLSGAAESSISEGDGVQRIRPECKAGLSPCFDSFSPLALRVAGFSVGDIFPNLFVLSSRGGVAKASSVDSIVSFNFAGSDWQNLDWIEVGFYLPQICENDPPEGTEELCSNNHEKALEIQDLTFEAVAVPEPALLSLLAAGALGAGIRRRYRS